MFDFLLDISPVLKILLVFIVILIVNRFWISLGLALALGGGMLDLWSGKSISQIFIDYADAFMTPELWLLLINISLVLEFGYFMTHEKNSALILRASQKIGGQNGRALSLIIMPAAIGLVPMPGGALFSAPLVGEALKDRDVSPPWKVMVNYWFRHVFEYWWPLYPVVLLTLSIFSVKTWQFFLFQVPFTLVSLLAGWFFLIRQNLDLLSDAPNKISGEGGLFNVLLPILIVVFCTLLLPIAFGSLAPQFSPTMHKLLAMFSGLVVGLSVVAWSTRKQKDRPLFTYLFSRKTGHVVAILAGVMVFQEMLNSSGLLPLAGQQLLDSAIPVEVVICFLPLLAGFVTGIAVGFAGPAFPLVVGFAAAVPQVSELSALVLAFSMGYAGMMLSPVHLCFVLTRKHFSVGQSAPYYYLVPCVLTAIGWGIISHIFLRTIGW